MIDEDVYNAEGEEDIETLSDVPEESGGDEDEEEEHVAGEEDAEEMYE